MTITTLPQARLAIIRAYADLRAVLAAPMQAALDALVSSPAIAPPELPVEVFHLAYANRTDLTGPLATMAADVGQYCTDLGFRGLQADDRGYLMAKVLRGEALPEGATEPAADPRYVVAE